MVNVAALQQPSCGCTWGGGGGGLPSTQEARVALGYRLVRLLRFFRAS